ncbi:hypothetical protein TI03_03235 [Achromatium sp. WMS1]|nr:hypothetical protein TI03_03235 [Achromatium sp. WMS1]
MFGPEHYHFTSPPQLWDWIQFTGAHILRAGDILDVIEEYKIDIQNVTHGGNFVATVIMAMHWMVDIFLLGYLWSLTKNLRFEKWFEEKIYDIWSYELSLLTFSLLASLLIIVLLLFTIFVQQAIYSTIDLDWIWYHGLLLWPLDNIIRVIDVGDSFQLYQMQLHSITVNWWTSSLAVVFRLLISVPLAELLNYCHLICFKGVGKSIPELITDLANDHTRDGAIQGLVRLRKSAVPNLVTALTDNDYVVRKAAAKALDKIDPQWQQSEGAKVAIPDLVKALADEDYGFIYAAAYALGQIDPQWRQKYR